MVRYGLTPGLVALTLAALWTYVFWRLRIARLWKPVTAVVRRQAGFLQWRLHYRWGGLPYEEAPLIGRAAGFALGDGESVAALVNPHHPEHVVLNIAPPWALPAVAVAITFASLGLFGAAWRSLLAAG